jgi:hypothetical protein
MMITKLAIASALACATLLAPQAHATTQDDQYLQALAAQGISGDPGQLIAAGHTICDNWVGGSRGAHPWGIYGEKLTIMQQFALSDAQAVAMMTVHQTIGQRNEQMRLIAEGHHTGRINPDGRLCAGRRHRVDGSAGTS